MVIKQIPTWKTKTYSLFSLITVILLLMLNCHRDLGITDPIKLPPEPDWPVGEWILTGLENDDIVSVGVHPQKHNIILAGSYFNYSSQKPARLYRSEDYGATWDTLAVGETKGYRNFIFNPFNPDIVYAVGGERLLQSDNIGKSWQDITGSIVTNWETFTCCMAFNPLDPNEVYVGTSGFMGGELYKSNNIGKSWECITQNITNNSITDIAINPKKTNVLYFSTDMDGNVWKSENSGKSWVLTGLHGTATATMDLMIDNNNTNIMYAASEEIEIKDIKIEYGVMKSTNGGNTWKQFNNGLPNWYKSIQIEKNYRTGDLYVITTYSNNGEIYKYNNNLERWEKFGIENVITSFYKSHFTFSPDYRYLYLACKGVYVIKLY